MSQSATTPPPMVAFDLYKDVHKAIRVNLFDLVAAAGRLDPNDRPARIGHAAQVCDLIDFLIFHADHEDTQLEAVVAEILPDRAAAIAAEHVDLEATMAELKALACVVFDEDAGDSRAALHALYLDLALFTSRYLAHQDVEERVVMPALCAAYGVDPLLEINGRILASINPEQMGWSLVKMLPAMNVDDRVEMLAGVQTEAPPEAFVGVLALAADILSERDHQHLVAGLQDGVVGAA